MGAKSIRKISVLVGYILKVYSERGVRGVLNKLKVKRVRAKALEIIQIGEILDERSNSKVFVLSPNDTTWVSHDYRGSNIQIALNKLGIETRVVPNYNFLQNQELQERTHSVFFFRTDTPICDYTKLSNSTKIYYDTDDLCFDKRYYTVENVAGLLATSPKNREWLLGGSLDGQENAISNSDVGTGPTARITKSMSEIGCPKTFLLDNVLPPWMEAQSTEFRRESPTLQGTFDLLYASGSDTHQKDFEACWTDLLAFLSKNRNATLTILGHSPINYQNIPKNVVEQIHFAKLVEHRNLIEFHSRFDLAIAPLEINPFTEAKSALKFTHAASLGIPCLASPTEPFRRLMTGEAANLLVKDNNWLEKLEELQSQEKYSEMSSVVASIYNNRLLFKNLETQVEELLSI
jgi:hypothetical protein